MGEIQHPHKVKALMKVETELLDKGLGHLPMNLSPYLHV